MCVFLKLRSSLLLLLIWAFLTETAASQYFGQNKVRSKDLDWQVLKTEHFDIHYYPEIADAAEMVGRMAERWYARLSSILNHELPANQPIILYDSAPVFRQTTALSGDIGVGTGGVTEGLRRRVILPMAATLAETDHVLGHELVHAFQYHMTSGPGNSAAGGVPGVATLPLWFVEGMAEYLSVGPVDTNTAMWLRDAVQRKKLPDLKQLDDPEYFPYRFGQAFWSYVAGVYGDDKISRMLLAAGRANNPAPAIQSVLEVTPGSLIERWHSALNDAYSPVIRETRAATEQARTVIPAQEGRNSLNVSPAISPDGKTMVVFSERNLFSIELFLVNAETGETIRKITETAADSHFDSMEFIQSSGAWSRDGSRFAFPALNEGRPRLAIYNLQERRVAQEFEFRQLGEIFAPSWSADDKQIAFSAIAAGLTDIFIVDLDTGNLRRVTNDAFADLHPAWSPSGRYLAFVTDRFDTNLDSLAYGPYKLALYDLQQNRMSALPAFPAGKHIDPQFGNDDNVLFFVSDQNGVPNIYRLNRPDGSITQVTQIQTGVSGIGALSPAISVAGANRVFFSSFQEGRYSVYSLDGNNSIDAARLDYVRVATLPPLERGSNVVAEALRRPQAGLAEASSFESGDYRPRLSLDYVAPPSIAVGVSNYGALVGGGTALYFSDLLQQHQLMTSFQTVSILDGNFLRNLAAGGAYENRKSRWTWGFSGGQIPYVSNAYSVDLATVDGRLVGVENSLTLWQIERQATGLLAYPFSRAKRMEFTGGYRNIGFAAQRRQDAFLLTTGEQIASQTTDLDAPSAINVATAGTAFVHDTSVFGGVSPLLGSRYRLEAGVQLGGLNLSSILADYRRYVRLPGNLTFATRAMHFGRYGGDAEDERLQDLFIGYPALVRGYSTDSFDISECGPALQQTGDCPAFDQLVGSRMAVGNAELRVPILGVLGLVPSRGFPPVEIAPFFDMGIAWRRTSAPAFLRMDRAILSEVTAGVCVPTCWDFFRYNSVT